MTRLLGTPGPSPLKIKGSEWYTNIFTRTVEKKAFIICAKGYNGTWMFLKNACLIREVEQDMYKSSTGYVSTLDWEIRYYWLSAEDCTMCLLSGEIRNETYDD